MASSLEFSGSIGTRNKTRKQVEARPGAEKCHIARLLTQRRPVSLAMQVATEGANKRARLRNYKCNFKTQDEQRLSKGSTKSLFSKPVGVLQLLATLLLLLLLLFQLGKWFALISMRATVLF